DTTSFTEYVKTLSADEFLGRKPFTKGDSLTVDYIAEEFRRIGLQPGNGDSYFQEVPMVEITSTPGSELLLSNNKRHVQLAYLDDYVIGSLRTDAQVSIPETELVFA